MSDNTGEIPIQFVKITHRFDKSNQSSSKLILDFEESIFTSLQALWEKQFDHPNDANTLGKYISEKKLQRFYKQAKLSLEKFCHSDHEFLEVQHYIERFIDYQNRYINEKEFKYPKPVFAVVKPNNLVIEEDWVEQGIQLDAVVSCVKSYWQSTDSFSFEEKVCWLIFSGIVWGGINDKNVLAAWLNHLLLDKPIHPFINHRTYITLKFQTKNFGNERNPETNAIFNSHQVILDLMSSMWLVHIKKTHGFVERSSFDFDKWEYLLEKNLKRVTQDHIQHTPTLSWLLKYANYHWELIPGVDIPTCSAEHLRGHNATTGMTQTRFDLLLNASFTVCLRHYRIEDILKLTIETDNSQTQKNLIASSDIVYSRERKSDIMADLSRALSKKPDEIADKLALLLKRYQNIADTMFIGWLLFLVKKKDGASLKSIKKYMGVIASEWFFFTYNEPLHLYDEDDFLELYEEILEYKAIQKGNKDIGGPARLLQRMHHYAVDNLSVVKVSVPHTKSAKLVRADIMPPQLYQAILAQIDNSVPKPHHIMFKLAFIILYRVGLRKKELLGLKYADIEGFIKRKPSCVIRPKPNYSLKTKNSNRRVDFKALLKPDELDLFHYYVECNQTKHNSRYLFAINEAPLPSHALLNLLKQVLTDLSDEFNELTEQNFNLHSFRHTAISNLFLAFHGDSALVELLTDLTETDVERIKTRLIGYQSVNQDKMYATAYMAGHMTPHRTNQYYIHYGYLAASYALSHADITLNKSFLLQHLKKQRFPKLTDAENESLDYPLTAIRHLLYKDVLVGKYKKSPKFYIADAMQKPYTIATDMKQDMFDGYFLSQVLGFLELLESDKPIAVAAKEKLINSEDAMRYATNANNVRKLTTKKGNCKFFANEDFEKTNQLVPYQLKTYKERQLLPTLFLNMYHLKKQQPDVWQWFFKTLVKKVNFSSVELLFSPKNETNDLKRFLRMVLDLLPENHWCLIVPNGLDNTSMVELANTHNIKIKYTDRHELYGIGVLASKRNEKQTILSGILRYAAHISLIFYASDLT